MDNAKIDQYNKYLSKEFPELFVALNFHKTHKNELISFDGMPYLREIYMNRADYMVFKKATQMGLSEYLLIRAVTSAARGRGVFYVLPTGHVVGRFVKNRIDRSIDFTPFYRQLLKYNPSRFSESISLKHIGYGSIAFVGSNATAGFTEFPADDLIIDELDECDQENLNMAIERLSASAEKRIVKVGNPKLMNYGIDREYNKTDRREWFVKCPHCNEWQVMDFFKNVVEEVEPKEFVILDEKWDHGSASDIEVLCVKCKRALDRHVTGEWVPTNTSDIPGYHLSKLFSKNVKITELVNRFDEGQTDDTVLERFYNGDLGLAFSASGSKLSYDDLRKCMDMAYLMPSSSEKTNLAGIDVGNKLHVVIGEKLPDSRVKANYIGTVDDEEDLYDLFKRYNVRFGVIDGLPEKRMSKRVCAHIRGMFMCFYGDVKVERADPEHKIITVDRTSSLDSVKSAVMTQSIILPRNADKMMPITKDSKNEAVSLFFYEMTTSTRVKNEARQVYEWAEGGNPDHFFHAMNYLLIASRLAIIAAK